MSGGKALAEFLKGGAFETKVERGDPQQGDPMDRLGAVLVKAGEAGLPIDEALKRSDLPRSEFFSALGMAGKLNLIETVGEGGKSRLRLTEAARSLY